MSKNYGKDLKEKLETMMVDKRASKGLVDPKGVFGSSEDLSKYEWKTYPDPSKVYKEELITSGSFTSSGTVYSPGSWTAMPSSSPIPTTIHQQLVLGEVRDLMERFYEEGLSGDEIILNLMNHVLSNLQVYYDNKNFVIVPTHITKKML